MLKDKRGRENASQIGDAMECLADIVMAACLEHHDDAALIRRHYLGARKRGNARDNRVLVGWPRLHHR